MMYQNPYQPPFNSVYDMQMPQQMQFQPRPMMQQQQPQMQMPQMQVQQQFPLLKIVDSSDVVKTMDIPMDGNTYYFPKGDGSEIYTKRWLQNGTTEQVIYKKVDAVEQEQKVDPLFEKLNGIEEQINKIEELLGKQKTTKKEVTKDA